MQMLSSEVLSSLSQHSPLMIGANAPVHAHRSPINVNEVQGDALSLRLVTELVSALSMKWCNAPVIQVVQSVSDMPMPVEYDAAGVSVNDEVFLIADNLLNADHAEFVLIHEVLGHYGLSGLLGNRLDDIMLKIYADNDAVRVKADAWLTEYGSTDVARATEEALSDSAIDARQMTGWETLVGAFRKGCRAIGFNLKMNPLDIQLLLSDSRRYVEQGKSVSSVNSVLMSYSRIHKTLTQHFKSWFATSKVVDDNGKPLIVYTGTDKDFEVFNTMGGAGKTHETGAFFSSNAANAGTYTGGINGGHIIPVYLCLENPAVFDAKGKNWARLGKGTRVDLPRVTVSDQSDEQLLAALEGRDPQADVTKTLKARKTNLGRLFPNELVYDDDYFSTDYLARWARKQGYDGVIFKNVRDQGGTGSLMTDEAMQPCNVYVCFRPEQIKSAIGNTGAFSKDNPDIRYSRVPKRDMNVNEDYQPNF